MVSSRVVACFFIFSHKMSHLERDISDFSDEKYIFLIMAANFDHEYTFHGLPKKPLLLQRFFGGLHMGSESEPLYVYAAPYFP